MNFSVADAWSKYPYAGMLTASRGDYGAFDQCLSINHEPVEGPRILGKQCTFGLAIPVDLNFQVSVNINVKCFDCIQLFQWGRLISEHSVYIIKRVNY